MKYKIDHPREIAHEFTSIADSRKMYSLEQYLFKQREDGEVSKDGIIHLPNPLEIFSDESRFLVTIVDGASSTFCNANIPLADFYEIEEETRYAFDQILKCRHKGNSNTNKDDPAGQAAYNVLIEFGKFKGKSPAQVLQENSDNLAQLKNSENWLADRIGQYKNNQKQYDAIKNAIELFEEGKLIGSPVLNGDIFLIYDSGFKSQVRQRGEDGRCPVYQIKIKCNTAKNYPISIEIQNFYTFCNGIIPDLKKMINHKEDTFNMDLKTWKKSVEAMRRTIHICEQMWGSYEWTRMEQYIDKYKNNTK